MWAVKNGSRSVAHWYASDEHPRVPLMHAVCGRYSSNHIRAQDLSPSDRKQCGDCAKILGTVQVTDQK